MAKRKPLVMVAGQMQQLQAGDTLDAPTDKPDLYDLTNGEAGPIVIGTPVYISGADTAKKAKADAPGTAAVVGLVYDASIANGVAGQVIIGGVLSATTGQWDTVAGTTGGLTANTLYFLSDVTAGMLTATAPTAVGTSVTVVGRAISSTELNLMLNEPILL